jgi:hypothetical protein
VRNKNIATVYSCDTENEGETMSDGREEREEAPAVHGRGRIGRIAKTAFIAMMARIGSPSR